MVLSIEDAPKSFRPNPDQVASPTVLIAIGNLQGYAIGFAGLFNAQFPAFRS
jgi:hypothetical protein